MARFFGTYEHSLDGKGRVILPARFRAAFEHGGYLTQYRDGCLALWTPDEFERQMEEMQERAASGKSDRTWPGCGRRTPRTWRSTVRAGWRSRPGCGSTPRSRATSRRRGDRPGGAVGPGPVAENIGPEEQRLTEGADD